MTPPTAQPMEDWNVAVRVPAERLLRLTVTSDAKGDCRVVAVGDKGRTTTIDDNDPFFRVGDRLITLDCVPFAKSKTESNAANPEWHRMLAGTTSTTTRPRLVFLHRIEGNAREGMTDVEAKHVVAKEATSTTTTKVAAETKEAEPATAVPATADTDRSPSLSPGRKNTGEEKEGKNDDDGGGGAGLDRAVGLFVQNFPFLHRRGYLPWVAHEAISFLTDQKHGDRKRLVRLRPTREEKPGQPVQTWVLSQEDQQADNASAAGSSGVCQQQRDEPHDEAVNNGKRKALEDCPSDVPNTSKIRGPTLQEQTSNQVSDSHLETAKKRKLTVDTLEPVSVDPPSPPDTDAAFERSVVVFLQKCRKLNRDEHLKRIAYEAMYLLSDQGENDVVRLGKPDRKRPARTWVVRERSNSRRAVAEATARPFSPSLPPTSLTTTTVTLDQVVLFLNKLKEERDREQLEWLANEAISIFTENGKTKEVQVGPEPTEEKKGRPVWTCMVKEEYDTRAEAAEAEARALAAVPRADNVTLDQVIDFLHQLNSHYAAADGEPPEPIAKKLRWIAFYVVSVLTDGGFEVRFGPKDGGQEQVWVRRHKLGFDRMFCGQTGTTRCVAVSRSGKHCSFVAVAPTPYCYVHAKFNTLPHKTATMDQCNQESSEDQEVEN